MAIVLTGATGHLGFSIAKHLVDQNRSVIALYRSSSPPQALKALQKLGVQLIEMDLLTLDEPQPFESRPIEGLIHCAAVFSYDLSEERSLYATNMRLTEKVVRLAQIIEAPKLVATSSVAAVGLRSSKDAPLTSDDWYRSPVPYLRSKHDSEQLLFKLCGKAQISLTTICPTHIIGPRFFKLTPSLQVISDMYFNRFPISPPLSMNLVDVRDVAKAQTQALSLAQNGRYLVGAKQPYSFHQTAQLMSEISRSVRVPTLRIPKPPLSWALGRSVSLLEWLKPVSLGPFNQFAASSHALLLQLNEFFSGEIWIDLNPAEVDLNFQSRSLTDSLKDTMVELRMRRTTHDPR